MVENTLDCKQVDLEAIETFLRSSMQNIGCGILGRILNTHLVHEEDTSVKCPQGHRARFVAYRRKLLMTVLGPVEIWRRYYYDARCRHGWCPKDSILDIADTMFSPGVRNMMAYVGSRGPFKEGEEDLRRLAGLRIPAKSIERLSRMIGRQAEEYFWKQKQGSDLRGLDQRTKRKTMYIAYDGTGIPVLKRETVGRKGKDGEAKTREVKVGCIFTQTRMDDQGYPIRDEVSTSYVGACEKVEEFSRRIAHEAEIRGSCHTRRVCVIGDGAPWIWNIADEQFPTAIQIIDLYHAREHYGEVARMVFPEKSTEGKRWIEKRKKELNDGNIRAVVRALRRLTPRTKQAQHVCEKAIAYFQRNEHRMRYAYFRSLGLFVGSGVVEAGCKSLVGKRLKQSGMHWSVQAANNIIQLRSLFLSNHWDDFWEYRTAA